MTILLSNYVGGGLGQTEVDARINTLTTGRKTKAFYMNPHMRIGLTQNPSAETTLGGSGGNAQVVARLFDPTAVEYVYFDWQIPDNFDETWGLAFIPIWAPMTTNTGDVAFEIRTRSYTEGDAIDSSMITGSPLLLSTDTALGTSQAIQYGPESTNSTFSGSLLKGEMVVIRYQRLSIDAGDTFTGDAAIIGIKLVWKTDSANEA